VKQKQKQTRSKTQPAPKTVPPQKPTRVRETVEAPGPIAEGILADRKYKQSQVAAFEGVTPRSIYNYIRDKKFPPPDFPAQRKGESNRWLGRTLLRVRGEQGTP
jgi:hypothetical protein